MSDDAGERGWEPSGYPAPISDQPPRPPSPGARIGRAVGVEVRRESRYASSNSPSELTVLAFRLDEPGNPRPLDVQLRGRSLSGTVRDGDWIEVAGAPDATGRYDVAKVANLTTASTVFVVGSKPTGAGRVLGVLVICFMLVVAVALFVGIMAFFFSAG